MKHLQINEIYLNIQDAIQNSVHAYGLLMFPKSETAHRLLTIQMHSKSKFFIDVNCELWYVDHSDLCLKRFDWKPVKYQGPVSICAVQDHVLSISDLRDDAGAVKRFIQSEGREGLYYTYELI